MKRICTRLTAALALLALVLSLTPAALAVGEVTAKAGNIDLTLNGTAMKLGTYNIANNNYVKLRDVAQLLKSTGKGFSITWNGAEQRIDLTSGGTYQTVGGELGALAEGTQTAVPNASSVWLNGKAVSLTAYTINGNNFFKLRDLGSALDFFVGWDAATGNVIVDTGKGYVPEAPASNGDQSAMARAMLAALEADMATHDENSYANARLVDVDGDGVVELLTNRFDPDIWVNLTIYDWKNGTLQKVWEYRPSGSWEWYLCKNTATGEVGAEFHISDRGPLSLCSSSFNYPSSSFVLRYQYKDETFSSIVYEGFFGDDSETYTQAEWQVLRDQNQRLELLMKMYDSGPEWENVAAVRAQLNEML